MKCVKTWILSNENQIATALTRKQNREGSIPLPMILPDTAAASLVRAEYLELSAQAIQVEIFWEPYLGQI